MRVSAAAVCSVFSLGALAQGALTPAARTSIERAQATGVFAGLQRSVTTPLEIVWLRTVAEIEAWSKPEMREASVGRTGWRYIFGGNAPFAPAPNEVARLLVSSLRLPKAPFTTGKLDLSGSGRLFVIAPEAPAVSADVALILAAGSTLQVSDAASPNLQIELKAPEDRALLLGNLASANVRKMLALLVKPSVVNASAASVSDGKVALRSGGEIELASIVDGRTDLLEVPTAVAAAPAPAPAPGPAAPEAPRPVVSEPALDATQITVVAMAELQAAPLAPVQETPITVAAAPVIRVEAPKEPAPEAPAAAKLAPIEVAGSQPEPVSVMVETPAAAQIEEAATATLPEPAPPVQEAPIAVAVAPIAPVEAPAAPLAPVQETPIAVAAAPVEVPAAAAPTAAATVPEAKPAPVQVAVVHVESVRIGAEPKPILSANTPSSAAIARMRAEIEAEVAREQERLARQRTLAAPAAKRFILGV